MIEHFTFCRCNTWIRSLAGILAFVVNTSARTGTIAVRSTTDKSTSHFRIADEAWHTFADRTMVDTVTFGILAACRSISCTNWDTLPVDARMLAGAFVVRTASDSNALQLRIPIVPLPASAHRFMIFDAAFCVRAAVARISADSIEARLVRWTFAVANTSAYFFNSCYRITRSTAAADVSRRTHADHRTNRDGTDYLALGRSSTGLQNGAWVLAFVVQASESRWTFAIFAALWLRFRSTVNVRVPNVTFRASAQRHVVLDAAFSARRARIVVNAGIDALRVDALPVARTIAVRCASNDYTAIQRIASISAKTSAFRLVPVHVTFRIYAARIFNEARIDAVAVDASFS